MPRSGTIVVATFALVQEIMKETKIMYGTKFCLVFMLSLCTAALALRNSALAQPEAGAEMVQDSAFSVPLGGGQTLDVYQSITNQRRFYVSPTMDVLPQKGLEDRPVFARPSAASNAVQITLQLSVPDARDAVRADLAARQLPDGDGTQLTRDEIQVDALRIAAVRVDVANEDVRTLYGVSPYVLNSPPVRQKLDIELRVQRDKQDLADKISKGEVLVLLTYGYNQVNLDQSRRTLTMRQVANTDSVRDLQQQGKELFTADQMSNVASAIRTEITDISYPGLGEIEEQSLTIEDLLKAFSVGDIWKMRQDQLQDLDRRIYKELDLQIDPANYQPATVNKSVLETMRSTTETQTQVKNYLSQYDKAREKWSATAKGGYPPYFKANANFDKDVEKIRNQSDFSDEQLHEFVEQNHGVTYDTEDKLYRGLEIYDFRKVETFGEVVVSTVTYRPTLTSNAKNITARFDERNPDDAPVDWQPFSQIKLEVTQLWKTLEQNKEEEARQLSNLNSRISVVDGLAKDIAGGVSIVQGENNYRWSLLDEHSGNTKQMSLGDGRNMEYCPSGQYFVGAAIRNFGRELIIHCRALGGHGLK